MPARAMTAQRKQAIRALLEAEGNFIDHSRSTAFIVEEVEF